MDKATVLEAFLKPPDPFHVTESNRIPSRTKPTGACGRGTNGFGSILDCQVRHLHSKTFFLPDSVTETENLLSAVNGELV